MINWSYKKILWVSIGFHLICAIFSSGFHHFDEHFQIYEFLNYKIDGIQAEQLPWEFHQMVRPWFQVYFYLGIYKFFSLFGISSPFIYAFIFRVFTTLFGVYAFWKLLPTLRTWYKDEKYSKLTFLFLNFFWFIPYIQTRTNAESFSLSFFVLGFVYFLRSIDTDSIKWGLLSGLFLGAAYNTRYQLALMVMFLWFWALFFHKKSIKGIISSAISIAFMIGAGVVVDYFGYGKWTFAPYNLYVGNFTQDRLANSGESPFWYYLKVTFLRGIPLVSLPLIVGFFYSCKKYWKHPLVWSVVPLLLFHSIIGHKELRYIFPVIALSPLLFGFFVQDKFESLVNKKWKTRLINFCVGLNFSLLLFSILRPANPSVKFYNYLYKNNISEFYYKGENPFSMVGLPIEFYKRKILQPIEYQEGEHIVSNTEYKYMFYRHGRDIFKMKDNKDCENVFMSYPEWTLKFNIGNWVSRSRVWSLYRCKSI